jgi:hypothetical protein
VNVRLRETAPGVFRIDHDPDRHDDRVISLALVAHRLAERPTTQPGRFYGMLQARTQITEGLAVSRSEGLALVRDGFSPWGRS